MANVFDVAKYILDQKGRMSTMKLQKLCYYSQAWSLVWDEGELFEEEFQAWANGPVCPELFHHHRGEYSVSSGGILNEKLTSEGLMTEQQDSIDMVLSYYGEKNAQWLSTLTHMEEPWKIARKGIADGMPSQNIITKESMAMYYGSL